MEQTSFSPHWQSPCHFYQSQEHPHDHQSMTREAAWGKLHHLGASLSHEDWTRTSPDLTTWGPESWRSLTQHTHILHQLLSLNLINWMVKYLINGQSNCLINEYMKFHLERLISWWWKLLTASVKYWLHFYPRAVVWSVYFCGDCWLVDDLSCSLLNCLLTTESECQIVMGRNFSWISPGLSWFRDDPLLS